MGAYDMIQDFTVENSVFSPDDGTKAILHINGNIYEWDGKNNQGDNVENGVYYIKVEVTDKYGFVHIETRDVTVLTNGLTTELRVFNSAGEVVKVIPVDGITDYGSDSLSVTPAPPSAFSPGDGSGGSGSQNFAEITYMGTAVQWDGTNENGTMVGNGVYVIQLVGIDSKGSKTIAQTDITVLHNGYEVVNNVKVIPNPANAMSDKVVIIRYNIMKNATVRVKVYNIAGELVKRMDDYNGIGEVSWQIDETVASGVYAAVIYARTDKGMSKTVVQKLVILRR